MWIKLYSCSDYDLIYNFINRFQGSVSCILFGMPYYYQKRKALRSFVNTAPYSPKNTPSKLTSEHTKLM